VLKAMCCLNILLLACRLCAAAQPSDTAASALLQRAQDYHAAGRYLEALSLYRDCVTSSGPDSEKAAAYFGLGLIFDAYLDNSEQALAWYRRHIELGGAHSDRALHASALILERMLRSNDAAACRRELIRRYPAYAFDNGVQLGSDELSGGFPGRTAGAFDRERLRKMPGTVRVLIENTAGAVEVKGDPDLIVAAGGDAAGSRHGDTFVFRADNDSLYVNDTLHDHSEVAVRGAGRDRLQVNGRWYRSRISIRAEKGRVRVINHISLEQYLYGVLPREVYVSWPPAALQAQAVAARTYALYHMIVQRERSYDVLATTSSQVYGGLEREHPATNAAVDATRGVVLFSGNKLALTLYHANSGGVVEAVEDVWNSRLPYLCRVLDTFSLTGRGAEWSCSLSEPQVIEKLAGFGIEIGTPVNMQTVKRSGSGRVELIEIRGRDSSLMLSGNSLRLIMGPGVVKSTRFIVERDGADFSFTGTGYGHGVGMSQWGARSMAASGFDHQAILAHYYPGTHLAPWRVSGQ